MRTSKLFLILFFIFFSFRVFAQLQEPDISLDISPSYPKVSETVTAKLNSYVTDLNKANITWFIDNEKKQIGVGKKSFTFTMEDSGSPIELKAQIETLDGRNIEKTIDISSSNIDLLWEATDSYAPPFYKGKALGSKEGSFKVVAIPSIQGGSNNTNANNFSYAWEKDGNPQPNASGWGKSYFMFKNTYLDKTNNIEVKVSDITGNVNTENNLVVEPTLPKIIFYKKDPALGIDLSQALGNTLSIDKDGGTLVAMPYFFSPKDLNSSLLDFKWSINDTEVSTPNPKNELNVKGENGKSGNAKIKLMISNTKTLFQELEKEINVYF